MLYDPGPARLFTEDEFPRGIAAGTFEPIADALASELADVAAALGVQTRAIGDEGPTLIGREWDFLYDGAAAEIADQAGDSTLALGDAAAGADAIEDEFARLIGDLPPESSSNDVPPVDRGDGNVFAPTDWNETRGGGSSGGGSGIAGDGGGGGGGGGSDGPRLGAIARIRAAYRDLLHREIQQDELEDVERTGDRYAWSQVWVDAYLDEIRRRAGNVTDSGGGGGEGRSGERGVGEGGGGDDQRDDGAPPLLEQPRA